MQGTGRWSEPVRTGRPLSLRPLSLRGLLGSSVSVDTKPRNLPRVHDSIVYTYVFFCVDVVLMFAPIPFALILLGMHECRCFIGNDVLSRLVSPRNTRRLFPYACCIQYVCAVFIVFTCTVGLSMWVVNGLLVSVLTVLLVCSRL